MEERDDQVQMLIDCMQLHASQASTPCQEAMQESKNRDQAALTRQGQKTEEHWGDSLLKDPKASAK
jgi:hypothetical protein